MEKSKAIGRCQDIIGCPDDLPGDKRMTRKEAGLGTRLSHGWILINTTGYPQAARLSRLGR